VSDIIVYGIPGSPFLRAVEVTLKEKSADYRLQVVAPQESKGPEYLAERHPFGRVPAFEHDGFRLYETQAIVRYLDQVFPEPRLTPSDPREQARMNQVIGINDWYFFPKAVAPIGFNRIIGPKLLGLPGDDAAVAEAMPMARTCFAELDRLLGDKPYFTGENATLADIILASQLDLFVECAEGRELIGATSALPAWLDRMLQRPSFLATQPPEMLREAA
jgi:glutathione S-transferase